MLVTVLAVPLGGLILLLVMHLVEQRLDACPNSSAPGARPTDEESADAVPARERAVQAAA